MRSDSAVNLDELLPRVSLGGTRTANCPELVTVDFCSGLMSQTVIADSLAFRAAMIAELASRLNHWIGGMRELTAQTAFCAEHLMRLKEYEKALSLLERDLGGTRRNGTMTRLPSWIEAAPRKLPRTLGTFHRRRSVCRRVRTGLSAASQRSR